MNVPAPIRKATQVEAFVDEILPPDSTVLLNLPEGIDPKRFKNSLHIAVMMNPKLLKCDPRLVFREVARAANYGISLDPSLGQGWLIIRRDRNGRDEPAFQLGYRGKLVLARQSGEVARLVAYPVSERCLAEGRFKVTLDALVYEPDPFGDDSPIVGFFAYCKYKDHTEDFECMSLREIHKIRDRSDGWRAFKKGSIKSTPWADYEGEMCKKTVLSRLLKRVPMSADLVKFMREDDAADFAPDLAEVEALPPERRQRVGRLETLRKMAQLDTPATPEKKEGFKGGVNLPEEPEPGTDEEQDEPAPEEMSDDTRVDRVSEEPEELPNPLDPPDPDEPVIDRKSKDFQRGHEDYAAGLKRCLSADIRADPTRFEHWKAGWEVAKYADEEEANAREDT